ncbi:MAG TPA: 16S rRNA (guanine(527)-N(7))-methyltransferase RsmG [Phenylobacterium sp.]|uniref:16S rRNA (guanine(527)-N(7))-methyltransferase RsmG n=1 Tax=Phenylobacterium sp. TaxID=1871053 RepID=UPI002CDB4EC4|nr:16S rRNA (guanine(527)-N(7))-methyltransferase RsmG [Phenylobacterium sp.]HSV04578.1 16S rRNA (guanine(527)-N(7))-methyltransferase RsmG [Phenylobacterium sp.]
MTEKLRPPIAVIDAPSFAAVSGAAPDQVADLERFRRMLAERNQTMNLVGASTLPDFWNRHAWDSAQLMKLEPEACTWADLGAGAGLPGVVLAILGKESEGFHVHLVESVAKRCRFLAEVVAALDLPATVHNARAESLNLEVDGVTARACAPLSRLLGYARPYLQRGATGLFLKGQDVASELEEATKSWEFEAEIVPSLSDERGRIVRLRRLRRARRA